MSNKLTKMQSGEGLEQSRTDWNRLDAMSEKDIDASDIPVLDAAFFDNAEVVMPPEKKHVCIRLDADVLDWMKSQGKGSIVMISSIDGLVGMNGVCAYSASKFGIRGFAKATAMELGRSGIRVNSVCAAGGNAEMTAPWLDKMMPFLEHMLAYTEDRGIPGGATLEQVAKAVLYLASDASDGVTGIDVPVDGGATAGKWIEGFNSL